MNDCPKVSVIIPVYNVAAYLNESLKSVINQTLKEIEIICVNDGSTDTSPEILRKYTSEDRRIRIINQKNSGYGHAMNQGLKAAKGKYIGILEPDDFAEPDMYERLFNTAEENDADLVKSNFWIYRSADDTNIFSEPLRDKPYNTVISAEKEPQLAVTVPCIWSAIYRREMLEYKRIAFSETPGASYQDTAFAFKALVCSQRTIFIKDAFLHYRTDNENSSVNSGSKVFSICDEFQSIASFLNADNERRIRFNGAFQLHRFRTYIWNLNRIAPEYKGLFAMRIGSELIQADQARLLHEEDFPPELWIRAQEFISDHYKAIEALEITKYSRSYKIGRALTWPLRKIRDSLFMNKIN